MMENLPATVASAALTQAREAQRRLLGEQVAATLQAAGRSPHTRRSYETAIGLFLQRLEARHGEQIPADWRPLAQCATATHEGATGRTVYHSEWAYGGMAAVLALVTPGDLDDFRAWREDQGDSPNTASIRVYAVRTFLSVALRDGIIAPDAGHMIGLRPYRARVKRDTKPTGRRLTKAEVRQLREAAEASTPKGARDRALLDVMLFTGLRAAEVAGLQLDNFVQDGGRWWVVLQGKGQKTRRLKLHDAAYQSLARWLAVRGARLGDTGPVFVSVAKGGHLTDRQVNTSTVGRLVSEYGARAELAPPRGNNRLAPHDLRRTAARNAFDNGASLVKVQAMLGHASPETTAHYIGSYSDDADTAVDRINY
jgi:integrase/recombinase XerD